MYSHSPVVGGSGVVASFSEEDVFSFLLSALVTAKRRKKKGREEGREGRRKAGVKENGSTCI